MPACRRGWRISRSRYRARRPMTRRLLLVCCLFALLPAGAAEPYTLGGERKAAKPQSAAGAAHKARKALVHGAGVGDGSEVTPLLKELVLKLPALDGAA